MSPVTSITVVYDAACGLCSRMKKWAKQQSPLLRIEFLASDSFDARKRFPQLPAGELAVVGGTGEVWLGNRAWIVCLWALRDYRDLAVRLSSPLLLPLAREAFDVVSRNRAALSTMLRLRSEWELEQQLRKVLIQRCQMQT